MVNGCSNIDRSIGATGMKSTIVENVILGFGHLKAEIRVAVQLVGQLAKGLGLSAMSLLPVAPVCLC